MSNDRYILLLSKQLTGEISPEEQSMLDAWIKQSDTNQQLAKEMQDAWDSSALSPELPSLDLNADFTTLQARIRASESVQPMRASSVSWKLLRVAAVGLFLIAALWFVFTRNTDKGFDQSIMASANKKLIELADGTKVWLKAGSSLDYGTEINHAATRQVRLKGEAFFEVSHDAQHPFKVLLENGGTVEVLGTSFDVKSFAGGASSVVVKTGKVRFNPIPNKRGAILTPFQKGTYSSEKANIEVSTLSNFNEISWYAEELEFNNTPLAEVAQLLSAHYKAQIVLDNKSLETCPYTSPLTLKLSNKNIEAILGTLATTYNMQVLKKSDQEYHLKGGACPK